MSVTPLHSQETPIGAIRNALQICSNRITLGAADEEENYGAVMRLLNHAIEGLSEPNLAAMQAGAILLKEWDGTPDERRQLRDTIAGILKAQLEGTVLSTW